MCSTSQSAPHTLPFLFTQEAIDQVCADEYRDPVYVKTTALFDLPRVDLEGGEVRMEARKVEMKTSLIEYTNF